MANKRITELDELTAVAPDDELLVVDKSDVSMAPSGTSKRLKADNVVPALGGDLRGSPALAALSADALARSGEKYDAIFGDIRFAAPAVLSLRFDDSPTSDYSVTYPELKSRGLVATFGAISNGIDTAGRLTTAQALEMQARGMEFFTHSKYHGADPATWEEWVEELRGSREQLQALGLHGEGFISPGTWVGDEAFLDSPEKVDGTAIGMLLREYATACCYVEDDADPSLDRSLPCRRRYGWTHETVDGITDLGSLTNKVDRIIARSMCRQMLIHSDHIGAGGFLSLATFQGLLNYIATKRDAGLLEVRTSCGMTYARPGTPRNWINDGTFVIRATGAPDIWLPNASPSIDVGGGPSGDNAAQVDQTNWYQQTIGAHNMRSVEVTAQVKNGSGTAATARIQMQDYGSDGLPLGGIRNSTQACTGSFAPMRATFGTRRDTTWVRVYIQSTNANPVKFAQVRMVKL